MGRFIWKEICERGLLKGVVGEGNEHPEKMTIRFNKLRKQKAGLYFWGYFFCEILNIVCLVVCFAILNNLFDGQFFNYGSNVVNFDKEEKNAVNPMCNLFPTEVSCSVATGGIDGNADVTNILCILSNNLFNQYYFLVLWVWWVILLGLSGAGFVYRVAQIFSKDVSKIVLIYKLSPLGQGAGPGGWRSTARLTTSSWAGSARTSREVRWRRSWQSWQDLRSQLTMKARRS